MCIVVGFNYFKDMIFVDSFVSVNFSNVLQCMDKTTSYVIHMLENNQYKNFLLS